MSLAEAFSCFSRSCALMLHLCNLPMAHCTCQSEPSPVSCSSTRQDDSQLRPGDKTHVIVNVPMWLCRLRAALATPGSMSEQDHAKAVQLGLTPGSSNPLGNFRPFPRRRPPSHASLMSFFFFDFFALPWQLNPQFTLPCIALFPDLHCSKLLLHIIFIPTPVGPAVMSTPWAPSPSCS